MSRIRRATPVDRTALRSIQSLALPEPCPDLLEAGIQGSPPVFVIDAPDPVGYAIVVPDGDEIVHLAELAVHPNAQGNGYGSRLLRSLFDAYDDYERMEVTVAVANERAQQFYARHGFTDEARLEGCFDAGDGRLLARSLGPDESD